jgi:uncharacterized membrane protein YqhA
MRTLQRWLESAFETFLFNSRLIVILAVVGSLASSVMMFVRGVVVIWHTAKDFLHHFGDAHGAGDELSISLISSVDSFLFATVLLIFAMGIYELFISKIDPASRTEESRPNWLQIHSLDDLKSAVGKVILMILIVRLFESAVKMKYDSPLHLLYLGLSVLFVAGALFLQHASHKHDKHPKDAEHGHAKPKSITLPPESPSHEPVPMLLTARQAGPSMQPPYAQHPSMPPAYAQHPSQHPSMPPQQPYPTMAPPNGQAAPAMPWDPHTGQPYSVGPSAPRHY